jgi:hypothetical protein
VSRFVDADPIELAGNAFSSRNLTGGLDVRIMMPLERRV